jgi:phosphopantothenoylcysteine decarboxylase / phosphopantothenate---cysteine ligase
VLGGKRVVLGVSGGIAAYKAVEVCRLLVDAGAYVQPVLTEGAERFVGAVTFSALASEPAHTSLWDDADAIPHTRLGQGADLVVVAPATARLLGAYAAGISDDLLTATLLCTRAPVLVCPAMHTEMWEHPAVQANLDTLRSRGVHVVEPESGRLAGGDVGAGRLADPAAIVEAAAALLAPPTLAGVHVVVTAGGTREALDPVRFIGNRSSGKQGYALATEALARGAEVTLISTVDRPAPAGARVVAVESAADMAAAVAEVADADVIVMAAAVADFRPSTVAEGKMKKQEGPPTILLVGTTDILAGLGADRRPGQVLIGFAAETDDLASNAQAKLAGKGVDAIVANDVGAAGVGFAHDTNAVTIHVANGSVIEVGLADKRVVAGAVLDVVERLRAEQGAK